MNWDDLSLVLALPVGGLLNLISMMIVLTVHNYKQVLGQTHNVLFQTDYRNYEQLKKQVLQNSFRAAGPKPYISPSNSRSSSSTSGTDSIISFLTKVNIAIIAFSLWNVYYLAVSSRFYNLMYTDREPHTPSVKRFTLIDNYSLGQMLWDTIKSKVFGKKPSTKPKDVDDRDRDNDVIYKDIWQLQVWQPSKFNLYLLMSLNPLVNLINILLTELSFVKLLVTNLAVTGSMYYLISKFLVLLQDKQILYQEMFQEYQTKYVVPRTTTLKKDVLIDATTGPYYSTVLTDVVPFLSNKLRVFTTHDIEGKEVNNYHELKPRDPPTSSSSKRFLSKPYLRSTSPFRRGTTTPNYYNNDSYKFKLEINQLKKINNELSRQLQHFRTSYSPDAHASAPPSTVQDDSDHSEEDLPWYVPSTPRNDLIHNDTIIPPPSSTSHKTPSPFKMPDRTPSPSKSLRMSLPTRLAPNLTQSSSRLGSPTAAERINQFVRRSLNALLHRSSPNRSPSPLKPIWR
ncbi:Nuclear rim protein 1 [Scheffersomyces spartinae]|uniref:Nuclear rim protein 1 n=1 Tax=Scheffersomyces spartinae TaxID=45513 RepID=A0A9P8AG73_9ASCO|nr:Nuclear rim protein 1 [Scheffersomyces spartinae]KAG7191979.1 Nuclear rim protein 1 [Scheffersomyces spartinae]